MRRIVDGLCWGGVVLLLVTGMGACAGVGAKGEAPRVMGEKETLGWWMLDKEAEVGPVPGESYALYEKILRQAKAEIHYDAGEADLDKKEEEARAAMDGIDRILMENHIFFPPGDWVDTLAEGLEPHRLNDAEFAAMLENCGTQRRKDFALKHRGEVFHFMDCDVLCFFYISIGQEIGMDLKLIDAPHHNFLRCYLDAQTYINWEATVPEVRTDDFYILENGISEWAIETGCYMTPRTLEDIKGYFYCCRALRCEHQTPPNYKQAAADYEKSIALFPPGGTAKNNLAWLYVSVPGFWEKGLMMDALQLSLEAVSADPTDGENLDTLACAYAEMGNFREAIAYEKNAISRFFVTNPAEKDDKSEFELRLKAFEAGKTYLEAGGRKVKS